MTKSRRLLTLVIGLLAVTAVGTGLYGTETDNLRIQIISGVVFLISIFAVGRLARGRPPPEPVAEPPAPPPPPVETPTEKADKLSDYPEAGDETEDELYLVFARLDGIKTGAEFRDRIDAIIAENHLAPLSEDDIDRLAAEIDRKDLRGQAFVRSSGIAFVRQVRSGIDVEYAGLSWLGGLPTLNDMEWPRDAFGRAMHHLGQIDLATIPESVLPEGIPRMGAMAFFLTATSEGPALGKVVHIPQIGNRVTNPPEDIAPIYDGPDWGKRMKGHVRESAPVTFPRWPADFILLPMADQNKDDDARELMAELLPKQSEKDLSPANYLTTLPDFARPWFWDTAHRFTNSLRRARNDLQQTIAATRQRADAGESEIQADLDLLNNHASAFSQFVDEVSIWSVTHAPWEKMSVNDAAQLETYFAKVKDTGDKKAPFRPFYEPTDGAFESLDEATQATLVAATNAAPEVFALLPEPVRDDIDLRYRSAGKDHWHQMFGLADQPPSDGPRRTHHHLLMQFQSDQLLDWMWGDRGVVQFWLTDEDLHDQNWNAVEVTMSGQ